MKSLFHLVVFCLIHLSCSSQVDSVFIDTIPTPKSITTVTQINVADLFCNQNRQYVYHESRDTLLLSEVHIGQFCHCDHFEIVDSVQINDSGAKEVVFFRKCSGETNDHGGTFDIVEKTKLHKYEIWDLDKKEMLFGAVSYYKLDYNRFVIYEDPRHQSGQKHFRYNFSIDKEGVITINNIRGKDKALVGRKEGKYGFVDGKYAIQE